VVPATVSIAAVPVRAVPTGITLSQFLWPAFRLSSNHPSVLQKRLDKVTLTEGVSTATAGRVLGGYGYAIGEFQVKARQTAEWLAYRPNLFARGLITGKTQTIGIIAGDIQSPFYATIVRGVSDDARGHGFGVIVANSDETLPTELEAVKLLREKQVDGLLADLALVIER
jgi:LacI family transcriptional regulator